MRFSTKSTYGLKAMIHLARNYKKGSVSLSKIAKEENISLRYLERLFARLIKAKLLKSTKGVAGGYRLSKNPSDIDIYDIINALEGKTSSFHCFAEGGKIYCSNKCDCKVTSVFGRIEHAIISTMKSIKLKDLI